MNKKRFGLYGIAAILILAIIIGVAVLWQTELACDISYTIDSYDVDTNLIYVTLTASNLGNISHLQFYKADVHFSDMNCVEGQIISAEQDNSMDFINVAVSDAKRVTVKYKAELGKIDKHGSQGIATKSLLAFEGSQVFLMPDICFDKQENNIRSLSVRYNIPDGWVSVMPFAKTGEPETFLTRPSWNDVYALRKSAYVFGMLVPVSEPEVPIYLAPGVTSISESDIQGIVQLYDYFSELIGISDHTLPTFVALPMGQDGNGIIAGAGSESIAATFLSENRRDWELLAHRLFHAYFESQVRDISFHESPKLWFYEGLATYYENRAVQSLSVPVSWESGLEDPFQEMFAKYLYMRFKDVRLLTLTPISESSYANIGGIIEFLHYTQAPLIVYALEDESFKLCGEHDKALQYIIKHGRDEDVPLRKILSFSLGDEREFWDGYVTGTEIPPLWKSPEPVDDKTMEDILNTIEYTLWTWFVSDDPSYPLEKADVSQSLAVLEQAHSARFSDAATEQRIREAFPIVYAQLKARAFRAESLGLSYDDPLLRYKLAE